MSRRLRWGGVGGAIALAVLWPMALAPEPEALGSALSATRRCVVLLPMAALLGLAARCSGPRWPLWFAGVGIAFSLVWLGWGVAARLGDEATGWLSSLHDAAHERVWLPAVGVAAVAVLAGGGGPERSGAKAPETHRTGTSVAGAP